MTPVTAKSYRKHFQSPFLYFRQFTCIHVEVHDPVNFVSLPIHLVLCSTDVEADILQWEVELRLETVFTSLEKLEMVRTVLVEYWLSKNSSVLYFMLVSKGRGVSPLSEENSQVTSALGKASTLHSIWTFLPAMALTCGTGTDTRGRTEKIENYSKMLDGESLSVSHLTSI